VIPTSKKEIQIMRYELSDYEWSVIKPMLPNKPRGVPRENDRRGDDHDERNAEQGSWFAEAKLFEVSSASRAQGAPRFAAVPRSLIHWTISRIDLRLNQLHFDEAYLNEVFQTIGLFGSPLNC
jgi:transposase